MPKQKINREWTHTLGREPEGLEFLSEPERRTISKKCLESYSYGHGLTGNSIKELEFLSFIPGDPNYRVNVVDIHLVSEHLYETIGYHFSIPVTELSHEVRSFHAEEFSVTLVDVNSEGIASKRARYFHIKPSKSGQKHIDTILEHEHITERALSKHPYEIVGNEHDGYVMDVHVENECGIHARPAALIVRISKAHDCETYIKKKGDSRPVSAGSVMGVLTLGAPRGTELILETKNSRGCKADAYDCLISLKKLFIDKFGEK